MSSLLQVGPSSAKFSIPLNDLHGTLGVSKYVVGAAIGKQPPKASPLPRMVQCILPVTFYCPSDLEDEAKAVYLFPC